LGAVVAGAILFFVPGVGAPADSDGTAPVGLTVSVVSRAARKAADSEETVAAVTPVPRGSGRPTGAGHATAWEAATALRKLAGGKDCASAADSAPSLSPRMCAEARVGGRRGAGVFLFLAAGDGGAGVRATLGVAGTAATVVSAVGAGATGPTAFVALFFLRGAVAFFAMLAVAELTAEDTTGTGGA
jgi:hypothetical protein